MSETQLEFFKGVDILLALTGGPPTIELNDLDEVIDAIQPEDYNSDALQNRQGHAHSNSAGGRFHRTLSGGTCPSSGSITD